MIRKQRAGEAMDGFLTTETESTACPGGELMGRVSGFQYDKEKLI